MGSVDVTQNIELVNQAAVGTLKIAMDTITANTSYRKSKLEIHSKIDFAFPDHTGGAIYQADSMYLKYVILCSTKRIRQRLKLKDMFCFLL